MKLNKIQLVSSIQSCINDYHKPNGKPKHGKHDFSFYKDWERFVRVNTHGIFAERKDGIFEISIAGSDDDIDWGQNLDAVKVTTPFGANKKIKVHRGFYNAYMNIRDEVLYQAKDRKKILIDGHSMGSSISLLAYRDIIWQASHVWKKQVDIACTQWAGARVYNTAGMYSFRYCEGQIYLIELNNDPVCNVPPEWMGFRHVFDTYINLKMGFRLPIFNLPILRLISAWNHPPQRYSKAMKRYKGNV